MLPPSQKINNASQQRADLYQEVYALISNFILQLNYLANLSRKLNYQCIKEAMNAAQLTAIDRKTYQMLRMFKTYFTQDKNNIDFLKSLEIYLSSIFRGEVMRNIEPLGNPDYWFAYFIQSVIMTGKLGDDAQQEFELLCVKYNQYQQGLRLRDDTQIAP
ncbi:MAG: hypothetical protein OEY79_00015 [Anaplasmataceae bacterium]|nr:hypothetical protein [Anaplasmataceae bacterium]